MTCRGRQLVGQDQAVRDELSGKHESVVEACIALLIFERDNDRERRPDNGQYRRRDRQKIPLRNLKEKGDEQRPANQGTGFPSRPADTLGECILSTEVHDSSADVHDSTVLRFIARTRPVDRTYRSGSHQSCDHPGPKKWRYRGARRRRDLDREELRSKEVVNPDLLAFIKQ